MLNINDNKTTGVDDLKNKKEKLFIFRLLIFFITILKKQTYCQYIETDINKFVL